MRSVVLALLAAFLAVPANALAAADLTLAAKHQSVRYGATDELAGKLVDGDRPLPGQVIVLEGRRYPYEGSYRVLDRTTTKADGTFSFRTALDRNHRLRVAAPAQDTEAKYVQVYVLPDFELSFRAIKPGVVRLYQRYTVPKSVRLTAPTLFYLGKKSAKRATLRETGKLKRVRAGKYTSQVTVRLPASWNGAFRYASCFRASIGSGMGDPAQSCPRLNLKF